LPWTPIKITKEEIAAGNRQLKRKARFLLDENLDLAVAKALRALGWNSRAVEEVGLKGRDDEDILAYAHSEDRILVTNDGGFRNERRFPPNRSPGVIIIPQDLSQAARALGAIVPIVGWYREVFRGDIIQVDHAGTISVRSTQIDGRRRTTRYRYAKGPYPLEWQD
jgi:predicted nuclease of predicted toxin-antitoxin system